MIMIYISSYLSEKVEGVSRGWALSCPIFASAIESIQGCAKMGTFHIN